jgi:hypothetical protein
MKEAEMMTLSLDRGGRERENVGVEAGSDKMARGGGTAPFRDGVLRYGLVRKKGHPQSGWKG